MDGITPHDLIVPLREQVYDLRMKDIAGELTDPEEIEHYKFLCRRLDVGEKNLGTVETTNTKTTEEEEADYIFQISDERFWIEYGEGKFNHLPGNVVHHRCLIMVDPDELPDKPKLCIPVTLNIPQEIFDAGTSGTRGIY
jgi:hypothetical protein